MTNYVPLDDLKHYLHVTGSGDDALLADLLSRASRIIDDHCHRRFAAETATRYYDALGPHISHHLLILDDDLLTLTALTNGDGSTVDLANVILRPANWPPYFGITLKAASGLAWTYADSPESAIAVTGTWGFSESPPDAVIQAALRLATWLYRQRDVGVDTPASGGEVELTPRGVSRAPARLPRDIDDLLRPYVRMRLLGVA